MSSDNKVLKTILAASLRFKILYLEMTKAPKSKKRALYSMVNGTETQDKFCERVQDVRYAFCA